MRTLDTFKEFNYVFYDTASDKLLQEYDRMFNIVRSTGQALLQENIDSGILLENNGNVIAGAFFELNKAPNIILIQIIFVNEEFRKNGIYKKLHSLIDLIGKERNKSGVYSYIHLKNDLMQKTIADKIGYTTIMNIVRRDIK